jgi:hypothetical protein
MRGIPAGRDQRRSRRKPAPDHHDPECAVVIGEDSKELIRTERQAHGWANAADVPRPAITTTSPPFNVNRPNGPL